MIINPRSSEMMNDIFRAREHFYKDFLKKGIDYTEGYLSGFTGVRRILNEWALTSESNKYHGAKQALEELIKG